MLAKFLGRFQTKDSITENEEGLRKEGLVWMNRYFDF
jgi:hypothetical protein